MQNTFMAFGRRILFFSFIMSLTTLITAQNLTIFDPQSHYDEAGGLYDPS